MFRKWFGIIGLKRKTIEILREDIDKPLLYPHEIKRETRIICQKYSGKCYEVELWRPCFNGIRMRDDGTIPMAYEENKGFLGIGTSKGSRNSFVAEIYISRFTFIY